MRLRAGYTRAAASTGVRAKDSGARAGCAAVGLGLTGLGLGVAADLGPGLGPGLGLAALGLAALCSMLGCGSPAAPAPPSLKLPNIVNTLTAERVGDRVTLHWTMPVETTDGLALRGPLDAELCRSAGASAGTQPEKHAGQSGRPVASTGARTGVGTSAAAQPCVTVQTLHLTPGATAEATDILPGNLSSGAAQLLAYQVVVLNGKHRSAGRSAAAYVAGGDGPQAVVGLMAETTARGVILRWQPFAAQSHVSELLVRRELIGGPKQAAKPASAPNAATKPDATKSDATKADAGKADAGKKPHGRLASSTNNGSPTGRNQSNGIQSDRGKRAPQPRVDQAEALLRIPIASAGGTPAAEGKGTPGANAPDRTANAPDRTANAPNRTANAPNRAVDLGRALDATAQFGETYSYTAQGVFKDLMGGIPAEVRGAPAGPVIVTLKDIFPPTAPQGLAAVLVPPPGGNGSYAIDLSWTPDTEPDLAGYVVYRRDAGDSSSAEKASAAERISPRNAPVVAPYFHDAQAREGHHYLYSVSAVDEAGNESARSAEEEQDVPQEKP